MEKEQARGAGVGIGIDKIDASDVERLVSSSPSSKEKPVEATKNGEEFPKPRFWTRSSSSRLNEPVEGEGLDLEAERRLHEAHERHVPIPVAAAAGTVCSPGAGVAAAMARLGRESLSMED